MANSDSKHSREFRRMDDYVRGKLPSAEHEAFEQLLERNPDLRRLTASHREFFDLVREGQDLEAWEALAVEQPEAQLRSPGSGGPKAGGDGLLLEK